MTGLITVAGRRFGTAAQLVAHLSCPDVTDNVIRLWARRGLIHRYHRAGRGRGTTWYALDEVLTAERATRTGGRGRRRSTLALAA